MTIEFPEYERPDISNLTSLEETTALMARLTETLAKFEETLAPLKAQQEAGENERKALKEEYEQRMLDLHKRDKAIEEMMREAKYALRIIQKDSESVTRQYHELKRAQDLASEYATLETRWDALTIAAPWREWAKDHQIEAARKITWSQRMILADTMGLGKTLSAIAALDIIEAATRDARPDNPYGGDITTGWHKDPETGEEVYGDYLADGITKPCGKKILYFCPSTMLSNVNREVRRWAPHRSVVILGGQTKAARRFLIDMMKDHNEYVVICNYEAWRRDKTLIDDLIDIEFDTLIIDEAHNVKDRKSVAYRGIKRIFSESDIPFVVPMTGTPILNKPQDLFSLLTFTDPKRFRHENSFLFDYCRQDPDTGRWYFKPGGLERLSKLIGSRFLRRTKEQAGIILPPKTVVLHEIEIDAAAYPEQARVREEMRKWGSIILDPENGKSITAAAMIAVYTRLRQIETWPDGIEMKDQFGEVVAKVEIQESQKMDEIIRPNGPNHSYADAEGLLPEIVSDERVVIFSQFKKPLAELERRCVEAGIKVARLDGDTPQNVRDEIMADFDVTVTPDREKAKWDVVLCNYKVGGVGMNLTAATQMIILDEEWNPGKRDQAYDRIHRMGQDKPVTIHVLRDQGTVDNWLAKIISDKEDLVEGFHEAADGLAQKMWEDLKNGLL